MNLTNHDITLPEGIELHHLSMRRAPGYGSYWITYELRKKESLSLINYSLTTLSFGMIGMRMSQLTMRTLLNMLLIWF